MILDVCEKLKFIVPDAASALRQQLGINASASLVAAIRMVPHLLAIKEFLIVYSLTLFEILFQIDGR